MIRKADLQKQIDDLDKRLINQFQHFNSLYLKYVAKDDGIVEMWNKSIGELEKKIKFQNTQIQELRDLCYKIRFEQNHKPEFQIGDKVNKGVITDYQLLNREISYEWNYIIFDKNTEIHQSFWQSELKLKK